LAEIIDNDDRAALDQATTGVAASAQADVQLGWRSYAHLASIAYLGLGRRPLLRTQSELQATVNQSSLDRFPARLDRQQ
jgi:hypothetical protein